MSSKLLYGELLINKIENNNYNPLIKKYINNEWIDVSEIEKYKFLNFIKLEIFFGLNNFHYLNIKRLPSNKSKIIINDECLIVDVNNIKVNYNDIDSDKELFWHTTYSYQKWAYLDFITKNESSITYVSQYSTLFDYSIPHCLIPSDIAIPNIIFTIKIDENDQTLYYIKNDFKQTKIKISDSYYYRIIQNNIYINTNSVINYKYTPTLPSNLLLYLSNDINDIDTCKICFTYKKNIKFLPCLHELECSNCFKHHKNNKCPFCNQQIFLIVNL